MRFTIEKKSLARAVDIAAGTAQGKGIRPILRCVRIAAAGAGVAFEATDLAISVRYAASATVEREGVIVVEAARLKALAAGLDGDEVEVDAEAGVLRLASSGRSFRVTLDDASEWPDGALPELSGEGVGIDGAALSSAIKAVACAAAQEAQRYAINGVALDPAGFAVATDGKRLHVAELPRPQGTGIRVVPTAAARTIAEHADGPTRLWLDDSRLTAVCGGLTVSALLVQGRFPPWKEVIPDDNNVPHVISFDRDEVVSAVKAAQRMTSKDSFAVRLSVSAGSIRMTSRIPGVGDGEVRVPLSGESASVTVEPMGVNPAYLLAALGTLGDTVTLRMGKPSAPSVLSSGGVRCVVMPVDLS